MGSVDNKSALVWAGARSSAGSVMTTCTLRMNIKMQSYQNRNSHCGDKNGKTRLVIGHIYVCLRTTQKLAHSAAPIISCCVMIFYLFYSHDDVFDSAERI